MMHVQHTVNERQRMEELKRYNILDTPPDGNFDRITRLAATIFNVPIALITLVDTDRIWFKSTFGLDVYQINRDPGLCASAILSGEAYVVEDAISDPRTLSNPLVAGEMGLRFYAAAPLQTHDNHNLGTICLIDKTARNFGPKEKEMLQQLAAIVMEEMEMRLAIRNTVLKVKGISSDLKLHLQSTIGKIESIPEKKETASLLQHLEASSFYLDNIQHHLNTL